MGRSIFMKLLFAAEVQFILDIDQDSFNKFDKTPL